MLSTTKVTFLALASFFALTANAWARDVDPDSKAENYAKAWLRLDADRVGVQGAVGTTVPLGGLELAGNVVVSQPYPGVVDPLQNKKFSQPIGNDYRAPEVRLELGPALSSGGFFFLPKLALGYDFERKKVAPFVPELMTVIQGGPLYVESWVEFFFYSPFDVGAQNSFYTRDLLLVALSNHIALGPQVELTVAIKNSPGKALRALPIGAAANWSPADVFTLGLFVGVETQASARNAQHDFLSGRLTASVLF